jgi:hypothetical protein
MCHQIFRGHIAVIIKVKQIKCKFIARLGRRVVAIQWHVESLDEVIDIDSVQGLVMGQHDVKPFIQKLSLVPVVLAQTFFD